MAKIPPLLYGVAAMVGVAVAYFNGNKKVVKEFQKLTEQMAEAHQESRKSTKQMAEADQESQKSTNKLTEAIQESQKLTNKLTETNISISRAIDQNTDAVWELIKKLETMRLEEQKYKDKNLVSTIIESLPDILRSPLRDVDEQKNDSNIEGIIQGFAISETEKEKIDDIKNFPKICKQGKQKNFKVVEENISSDLKDFNNAIEQQSKSWIPFFDIFKKCVEDVVHIFKSKRDEVISMSVNCGVSEQDKPASKKPRLTADSANEDDVLTALTPPNSNECPPNTH